MKTKQWTQQTAFDWSVANLLRQRKKSIRAGVGCRLRAKTYKCAIGFLIPDKYYCEDMEGSLGETLDYLSDSHTELFDALMPVEALGAALQYLHDETNITEWPKEARHIARKFKLDSWILKEYTRNGNTIPDYVLETILEFIHPEIVADLLWKAEIPVKAEAGIPETIKT